MEELMKKKFIQTTIAIGMIVSIMGMGTSSIAVTASDLTNTDKKIEETKKELHGIQTEKSETMKQVQSLMGQITEYENQIAGLDHEIETMNGKIKESQNKLNKAEEDYQKQQETLEERMVAIYEAGETSYLDVLLSSSSVVDFISNYFVISEVAECDLDLLDRINKQKEEIEKAKEELETSKSEIVNVKSSKQSISTQLKSSKQEKDAKVAKLDENEKSTQAELEQFESDKRALSAELARIAKQEEEKRKQEGKNNSSGGGSLPPIVTEPSKSGYIFPIAGLSRASINNKTYPSYPGHTGVDANLNVKGKTVVAVKAGTVQKSMAYLSSSGYYSYGECVVVNHHDGTMTLYAHGLENTRRVQVGQKVTQGQALMTVGNTGNSRGTHLHFEVLVRGIPVNPFNYLP